MQKTMLLMLMMLMLMMLMMMGEKKDKKEKEKKENMLREKRHGQDTIAIYSSSQYVKFA